MLGSIVCQGSTALVFLAHIDVCPTSMHSGLQHPFAHDSPLSTLCLVPRYDSCVFSSDDPLFSWWISVKNAKPSAKLVTDACYNWTGILLDLALSCSLITMVAMQHAHVDVIRKYFHFRPVHSTLEPMVDRSHEFHQWVDLRPDCTSSLLSGLG